MRHHHPSTRGRRPQRVAEQIRQVVAAFLQEEARDPRIGLVTVTAVEVTADLQRAVVRYVVHRGGTDQTKDQSAEGLAQAAKAVRRRIGETLVLRVVPEVVFEMDKAHEHAARIEQLLAELKKPGEPPA